MDKALKNLNNHYIVCGAGQTGKNTIKELQRAKVSFVVIEKEREKIEELMEHNILLIHGDATNDETLEKAQIRRAKGVICSLNNDAGNVFTVLSCRQLNPQIYIVARAIEAHSEAKLLKAGADVTVSPNEIGGQRMAALALRPAIMSFLDVVQNNEEDLTINIQEVIVNEGSPLVGQTPKQADIRNRTGITIFGVINTNPKILNPPLDLIFQAGDKLLVLGTEN